MPQLKDIINASFYQLLLLYTLAVAIISLGLISKYTLHFELLAVVLGLMSIALPQLSFEEIRNKLVVASLFAMGIVGVVVMRTIPYLNNSIPLGYDAGIYKYAIEHGLRGMDKWIVTSITMEPGFLYLMEPLKLIFSAYTILTWGFIAAIALLGVTIYFCAKEYFGNRAAVISLLIYAVSVVQFYVFQYMYYRNVIGLALMLLAFLFLHRASKTTKLWDLNRITFVLLGGYLGAMHRATFFLFGISYFLYAISSPYTDRKFNFRLFFVNVVAGVSVLIIAFAFYIGRFLPAITTIINPVVEGFANPGESSGTFISFFQYQFLTLVYLPFVIMGVIYLLRKKQHNVLLIWTIINAAIVYFQFFFFKRFIIHLDIAFIVLAGVGASSLIEHKKKTGLIIVAILLIAAGITLTNNALNTSSPISPTELAVIKHLATTPADSYAMTTSAIYSPWVQGYSERKTIAPGLFDYDIHNRQEWNAFWSTNSTEKICAFIHEYPQPIYVFIGQKQKDNLASATECMALWYNDGENKIYEVR